MRIALLLLCCAVLALAIMALPSHNMAADTDRYSISEALADTMASHGIETADSGSGVVAFKAVAYTTQANPLAEPH